MNLIISSEFTAPISEVGAFRTLTLYASIFKHMDCFVESKQDEIDFYYSWLKEKGAYDFVKDMVRINEIGGYKIQYSDKIDRLNFDNLSNFILIVNLV
jgi:hypothetical protein